MPFEIEFFTNAIEANAYEIAFYLLKVYEESIHQNVNRAIESHVKSYDLNNKFLKSKLHMSKMLINVFTFNAAKEFLSIMEHKVFAETLENNIFAHSCNPLLTMSLMYEML